MNITTNKNYLSVTQKLAARNYVDGLESAWSATNIGRVSFEIFYQFVPRTFVLAVDFHLEILPLPCTNSERCLNHCQISVFVPVLFEKDHNASELEWP